MRRTANRSYVPRMRRFPFYTSISAALLLAACATAPEAADSGPPPETVIAQALADSNPYDAEAMLSELLALNSLTAEQRVQALYHRGSLRRQAADNRLGAIEDFEALLEIAPDHALAANARTELDYVRTDVEQIKVSMNRFLTLAQWFDGTWTLGGHEEAVARYRSSGLPPTPEQVETLVAAGYICEAGESDVRLHEFGEDRDDLTGLEWCADLTS
ncbi:MAG TPA: hypothetical protein DEB28_17635 [Hyphomonas sp.]|nr:hypothetical protein [Hyphomonas sp.]HAO35995.1 hypothetical protein [Hyphomonas sp.]HAW55456.1 hypothetical protein [Hyphomonas sp.]HBJ39726.1 hypothetical protein [Hyphomonas sp.]HBN92635.1 hypothetical protein [Hyphomonas sp.]